MRVRLFLRFLMPVKSLYWAYTSFLYPKLNIKFIASLSLTHEIEEIKLSSLKNFEIK